jgi:2-methylisocitrate lyase-like PEP mutase family enzyme
MSDLRSDLASGTFILAPGCYDAMSGLLIEQAGFRAAYLSGASIAYTRFGRPDIGLISMAEVADVVSQIRERVALPLVVDADTGFGNALNVMRTVRLLEARGASAIQIEDQTLPKRCGHLADKGLVSTAEMVGKVKAALDARQNESTIVIARTDAIAVEGFEPALERAEAYREAGADVLFVEAPTSEAELHAIATWFKGRVPLLANMVEGGATPIRSAEQLQGLGFSIAIFPGGTVRALVHALQGYFASLHAHGTTAPYRDRMLDLQGLNALLGTSEMIALGQRYQE